MIKQIKTIVIKPTAAVDSRRQGSNSLPVHIIIPDAALRGAIVEAVKLPEFGEILEESSITIALNAPEPMAVILDETAMDKKFLKTFESCFFDNRKKRFFVLGDTGTALKDHPGIESFAKPMRMGHLLTRLSFHFKARSRLNSGTAIFGPYRFDSQKRELIRQEDGTVIRLTEKESALLDHLFQNEGAVSREELLAAIWGHDGRIDTHTLETHIYQLRRKLDPDGKGLNLLVNEQGSYRLNHDDKDVPH